MNNIALLSHRNLKIFFRDRAGVFFSLLSALILFGLYALFLGNLQTEYLGSQFPQATDAEVSAFVTSWVFAGITMITTLTTGLAALSVFVDDAASGRFRDFLVSPIKRTSMIGGYLISSFIISVLMTTIVVVVGQLYVLLRGEPVMSWAELGQCAGYVLLSAGGFAAFSSFIVTFIRSSSAFASLSTIVGTIIGFLAGAYIPAGALPAGVVNVLNSLPFAQSAMLIRQPFTAGSLEALTDGQEQASAAVEEFYGITASVGDFTVSNGFAIAVLALMIVVFVALGTWRIGRRIR